MGNTLGPLAWLAHSLLTTDTSNPMWCDIKPYALFECEVKHMALYHIPFIRPYPSVHHYRWLYAFEAHFQPLIRVIKGDA